MLANQIPGPTANRPTHAVMVKAMAKLAGRDVLPSVKMPRRRARESVPRAPYNRAEDKLRTEFIKELRKHGVVVWRIEPCVRGEFGLADLFLYVPQKKITGFLEVKTPLGKLSPSQEKFAAICYSTKTN